MNLEDLSKWSNSKDCDCEYSWETFYKCCGKFLNEIKQTQTDRVTPCNICGIFHALDNPLGLCRGKHVG